MPRAMEVAFPTKRERFEDRRKDRDQRKLVDEFFDHPTLLAVQRLINRAVIQTLDYPVSTGKEGGVFRATGPQGFLAVKIRRIGNTAFRRLPPHVVELLRRESSARNFAGLMAGWTRREHTLLGILTAAEVRAPRPVAHWRNVLVMSFVGSPEGIAAPRLIDAPMPSPRAVYAALIVQIHRMVNRAGLVHGDLSPYNVLLHEGLPVIIDIAQAVPSTHPEAGRLMARDAANFARFFRHAGLEVTSADFLQATGGGRWEEGP